jgi:hypothetical protein
VLEAAYALKQQLDVYPGDRWWLLGVFAGIFVVLVEVLSYFSNRQERRWRVAR